MFKGTHKFLIHGEGRHDHGESRWILTDDQRIPTGWKYELLELTFEIYRWMLLTCEELL